MTWTPPPGTIGLTYSYGFTGFRASLGQTLANQTTQYTHAFVAVGNHDIIEPWPRGARIADIGDYEHDYVAYAFLPGLSHGQRRALAAAALSLDGVPHGLSDYAALALHRYGSRSRRVIRRLADPRRLLPAQFVTETYRRAGVELLPGFAVGDVTLEDLGALLMDSEEWELRVPCAEFGGQGARRAR